VKSPTKKQNTRNNYVPNKTEAAKKIENLIFNFNNSNKDRRSSGGGSVNDKDKGIVDTKNHENHEGGEHQHKQQQQLSVVQPPELKKIPKKSPNKTFKDNVELLTREKGL